ncbi:unnamed protein product [Amoebophrya sp. A120]|nr:unnamed protein product [Amoebophrya sp. A120]|eukprot:GSA120T00015371001.1
MPSRRAFGGPHLVNLPSFLFAGCHPVWRWPSSNLHMHDCGPPPPLAHARPLPASWRRFSRRRSRRRGRRKGPARRLLRGLILGALLWPRSALPALQPAGRCKGTAATLLPPPWWLCLASLARPAASSEGSGLFRCFRGPSKAFGLVVSLFFAASQKLRPQAQPKLGRRFSPDPDFHAQGQARS